MADKHYEPSKAEILASLVTGHGSYQHHMASIQRSHRFPLNLFYQIENLAKMAGAPVSLIINELLEIGLDALKNELPQEVVQKVRIATKEQTDSPTVTDSVEVKARNVAGKPKPARSR